MFWSNYCADHYPEQPLNFTAQQGAALTLPGRLLLGCACWRGSAGFQGKVAGMAAAQVIEQSAQASQPRRRRRPQTARHADNITRREEILAIAAHRFAQHGFEPTTVREIAKDAEIHSGGIYHHFLTKEDMLDEIIRAPLLSLTARAMAIFHGPADVETRLTAMFLLYLDHIKQHKSAHLLLFNERRFLRKHERFAYFADSQRSLFDAWLKLLEAGRADGLFRDDLNAFVTVTMILRMTNAIAEWFEDDSSYYTYITGHFSLDELIEAEISLIFHAIYAHPTPGRRPPLDQARLFLSQTTA